MFILVYTKKVNKMILIRFFTILCALLFAFNAQAQTDAGLRFIRARGKILCGTDLGIEALAHKDERGEWRGFDADICRSFAMAILGSADSFDMINVETQNASKYLETNKIDVMLGNHPFAASDEFKLQIVPVSEMYYTKQMFLAKKQENATSMLDYENSTICTVKSSEDLHYLEQYTNKYDLSFKILKFNTFAKAKEAFLLARCNLLTGTEVQLKSILPKITVNNVVLLPEEIALKPVFAYVAKSNNNLRIAIKWILNALIATEEYGLNSNNISIYKNQPETNIRNLLGQNPELWGVFSLRKDWLSEAIMVVGSYKEIYDRNFVNSDKIKIERYKNRLIKDGGLIQPKPFL